MAQLQGMDARLDTLSDKLCQCWPYCPIVGLPWWLHGVSLSFSRGTKDKDDDGVSNDDDDDEDEDEDASSSSDNEMTA